MDWLVGIIVFAAIVWIASKWKSKPAPSQPPLATDRIDAALHRSRQRKDAPAAPTVGAAKATAATAAKRAAVAGLTAPSQRRPASKVQGSARWLTKAESIQIAGLNIGGMVYVGEGLHRQDGRDDDNCLINPRLPVARQKPATEQASMPYWPSYSSVSPAARRHYLEWLAGGRRDPTVDVGFVFLFFYGLERRLFVDRADVAEIVGEVRRLRTVYGRNHSFDSYSHKLLDAAAMLSSQPDPPVLRPDISAGYEMPFDVRRYLGSKLAAREPLNAGDALAWTLSTPDTRLRTPAVRCFAEFKTLWSVRFEARYPGGLRVSIPRTRLKPVYRAASGTFTAPIDIGSLPDIAAVTAPLTPLRELAYACSDDLAVYSRLVGRKPQAAGTAEAAAALPPELLQSGAGKALQSVRNAIEPYLTAPDSRPIPTADLCVAVGVDAGPNDKLPAEAERQISIVLDRLGVGFEPDRRHGPSGPSRAGSVALFKADEGGPVEGDRAQYAAARTMVEVAALAAVADGEVVAGEVVAIERDLESLPGLRPAEIARLRARVRALVSDPPKQQTTLNRLAKLDSGERSRIAQSALSAILADGKVMPAEVKFLERLHKTLGLPADAVYATLHREAVVSDEPAIIAVETRVAGVPIPSEPALAPARKTGAPATQTHATTQPAVNIDAQRLARVKSETAAVSAILGSIFMDDQPIAVSPVAIQQRQRSPSPYEGLDGAHAPLLSALLEKPMDREEFAQLAISLKLMVDGAIETINEWAFDKFGDLAIEDGDEVSVASALRPKIEALRGELV